MKNSYNINKSDIEKIKSLNISSIENKLSTSNNLNMDTDEIIKSNNNNNENNVKENINLRNILFKSIRRKRDEAENYEIPKNIFKLINTLQIYFAYLKKCLTSLSSYNICVLIFFNIFHFPILNNIYLY